MEDRRDAQGTGDCSTEGNVVPFPRDWLGPREELVPIGTAREEEAAQPDTNDQAPLGAEAFWSEGSALVQDAFRGPAWDDRHLRPEPSPVQARAAGHRIARGGRLLRSRVPRLVRRMAAGQRPSSRVLSRVQPIHALATCGLLMVVIVFLDVGLGSIDARRSAGKSRPPASPAQSAGSRSAAAGTPPILAQGPVRSVQRPARVQTASGGKAGSHSPGPAPPRSGAANGQPARYVTTGSGSGSGASGGEATSGGGTGAGPVGPGAPFGPGRLG